jgi:hypothetical protein
MCAVWVRACVCVCARAMCVCDVCVCVCGAVWTCVRCDTGGGHGARGWSAHHDHLREETGEVNADGHEGNDALHHLALLVHVTLHRRLAQPCQQLLHLACSHQAASIINDID